MRYELPPSARSLLQLARVASLAGLLLFVAVVGWAVYSVLSNAPEFDAILSDNFLDPGKSGTFSFGQRAVGVALMLGSSITGAIGIWQTFRLFSNYLDGNIFALASAGRLRIIGWMVFLLAPITMLTHTAGSYLFTVWSEPGRQNVEISFGDGEVFAIVFGLLIVIVGHVMYQAIAMSEENDSFV